MIEISGKAMILTDIHFGRRKFSYDTFENSMLFFESEIFPIMKEVKTLFILGDFWDVRQYIDWRIFNLVLERFFDKLQELEVQVIMIIGNHDTYYKDSIDMNSVEFLSKMYSNVSVFKEDTFIDFNGKKLLFISWLVEGQKFDHSLLKNADMVLGHFEIKNFEILSGHKSTEGLDAEEFNGISVLSGHYHNKSTDKRITYLGVCEQMTWSDFNLRKGAHILNEDLSLTFIENTVSKKFIRIVLNTSLDTPVSVHGLDDGVIRFNNIGDILERYDITRHTIKLILKDISDIVKFNNIKVELDTNNIEYVIIDETPEMIEKINLHESEIKDDSIDLLSIFKTQLDEEELGVFLEVFNEASQDLN